MMRSALLLLATLLVAAAPAAAQMFQPTTFKLANGLEVVVIEDRRAPAVTHMVWYRVGSADEAAGKGGIAHFLEHLMFKGTANVKPGEFSKLVALQGGRDNAFTSYDYTGYFQTIAADRLDLVMRLEADRMTNLVLTDDQVNPEREVVREERRQTTEANPRAVLGEQVNAALWLNHPYGRPIIGWDHEIQALNTQDALDFYKLHYAPNNAILIVAGDVQPDRVRALAEQHYGPVPSRAVPARVRPQEPPARAARRVTLEDGRVRQPAWSRTWVAPSLTRGATEHAVPLSVLSEIMNGPTGRLELAMVRGEGPALGAALWYDDTAFDLSRATLSVTPKDGVEMDKVEAAADAIMRAVIEGGVTEEEVKRAKFKLRAAVLYQRDSFGTIARVFGAALTSGQTVEDVEKWLDRVDAVTPAQIQAAARAVFVPAGSVTATLLPRKDN